MADIEARAQGLFEPLKRSVDTPLLIALASVGEPSTVEVEPAQPVKKTRVPRSQPGSTRTIPPYALNPHRVASITDIETRAQRLFDPFRRPGTSALQMKWVTPQPMKVNRNASTVAAYFNRQMEQQRLLPEQRKAIKRVDQQFFEVRRLLFSDDRLTRQDKAQLVSVLNFERMKAREAIHTPLLHKEGIHMGSAEIRALIDKDEKEEKLSKFSISGPGPSQIPPVRERVQRIISNLTLQTDEKLSKERERELSAKDIYTRKARFSQNVHYLDKSTDKTLFVDTGKSIALRSNGITEAGVTVALQLAQQRFGSTLTINGSAEFKRLVVEAAAKGGMDIHFTDKAMNDSLKARRTELEIGQEGQTIEPAEAAAPVVATPAPDAAVAPAPAGPAEPSFILEREAEWRTTMRLSETDVLASSTVMQLRGENHALWLVASNDQSPAAVALMTAYMENGSYRESFKDTMEDIYDRVKDTPEATNGMEPAMTIAAKLVNGVERNLADLVGPAANARVASDAPTAVPAASPVDRKVIQGVLHEHGVAPYQHDVKNQASYFVSLQTDTGPRKLWGDGLKDVMQAQGFAQGERITLRDEGKQPVTLQQTQDDGSVKEIQAFRRTWSAEPQTTTQDTIKVAPPKAELAPSDVALEAVTVMASGSPASMGVTDLGTNVQHTPPSTPNANRVKAPSEPITIVHNGSPVAVDTDNADDVAKYIRQLKGEVKVQTLGIASATQRIGELVNMRDNHSTSRGPEFIEQCNTEIARAERSIQGSKAILADAQAGLQTLAAPALDMVISVNQMDVPTPAVPSAGALQKATVEPVTIVHNGEPLTVDPANAGDVAKYTKQLTTEVNVQTQGIASATQRIGELVNMRDNHSASRGPEFIEQCNTEISRAERSIEGRKVIIEQAETSLQKLSSIPSQLDVSNALDDAAGPEVKSTINPGLSTPEEDHGPEMD